MSNTYVSAVNIAGAVAFEPNSANVEAWHGYNVSQNGIDGGLYVYVGDKVERLDIDIDAFIEVAEKLAAMKRESEIAAENRRKAAEENRRNERLADLRYEVEAAEENVEEAQENVYDLTRQYELAQDRADDLDSDLYSAKQRRDDAENRLADAREQLAEFLAENPATGPFIDQYGDEWVLVNKDNLSTPHEFDPKKVDNVCYSRKY